MKKIEEVTLLYEISKTLNVTLELKKSLYKVLHILSLSTGMVRGTVTILNPVRNEIQIEVAHGLTKAAMERGRYKPGEGITGRVIQTGKALLVPKISEEPLFLNRTATRKAAGETELSFMCVPVKKGGEVIGALSVDRPFDESYSLNDGKRLLSIVATIMLPLTLITGIYGMNFRNLPGSQHYLGFWGVVIIMVVLSVSMLIIFRKNKWI